MKKSKIYYLHGVRRMNSIFDIARFFLSKGDENMTHKKLQKLCYYAYAWSLALRGEVLFNEKFQAWVHGPVSPELYQRYKEYGWKIIPKEDSPDLDDDLKEFLEVIYNTYGDFTGDELEYLTHSEEPWIEARKELAPYEPSTNYLDDCLIREYYLNADERGQND